MLFVNTRPQDRAQALTLALSEQNIEVVELPLLELKAIEFSAKLAALYQQLLSSEVIVVVSPTAVEIGMQYLQKSGLHLSQLAHIQWIAVGLKTAQVLAQYGICASIPDVETSEGMLQLPMLQQLTKGSQVAFWRGEGGRQFMMQQLQKQGMQILNMLLYHRQCPKISEQQIPLLAQKIQHAADVVVLISSEASWANWQMLWQHQLHSIKHAHYMVLGQRVAQLLQQDCEQLNLAPQITVLDTLQPATIVQTLRAQGNT